MSSPFDLASANQQTVSKTPTKTASDTSGGTNTTGSLKSPGSQTNVAVSHVPKPLILTPPAQRSFTPQSTVAVKSDPSGRQSTIEIHQPLPAGSQRPSGSSIKSVELTVSHELPAKPAAAVDRSSAAVARETAVVKPLTAQIKQVDLRHQDQTKTDLRDYSDRAAAKQDQTEQKAATHIIRSVKEFSKESKLPLEPQLEQDLTHLEQKLVDKGQTAATTAEAGQKTAPGKTTKTQETSAAAKELNQGTEAIKQDPAQVKVQSQKSAAEITDKPEKGAAPEKTTTPEKTSGGDKIATPDKPVKTADPAEAAKPSSPAKTSGTDKAAQDNETGQAIKTTEQPAKQGQQAAAAKENIKTNQEKPLPQRTAEVKEATQENKTPIKVADTTGTQNNADAKTSAEQNIKTQAPATASKENTAPPQDKPQAPTIGTKEQASANTPKEQTAAATTKPQNVSVGKTSTPQPGRAVDQFVATPKKLVLDIEQNANKISLTLAKAGQAKTGADRPTKSIDIKIESNAAFKTGQQVKAAQDSQDVNHVSVTVNSPAPAKPGQKPLIDSQTAKIDLKAQDLPSAKKISFMVTGDLEAVRRMTAEKDVDQAKAVRRNQTETETSGQVKERGRQRKASEAKPTETLTAAKTKDRDASRIVQAEVKAEDQVREARTQEKHRQEDKQEQHRDQQRQGQDQREDQEQQERRQKKRQEEEAEFAPGEALRDLAETCRLDETDRSQLEALLSGLAAKKVEELKAMSLDSQKAITTQLFAQLQNLAAQLNLPLGLTLGQVLALIEAGFGSLVISALIDLIAKLQALLAKLRTFFQMFRQELAEIGIDSFEQLVQELALGSADSGELQTKLTALVQRIELAQSGQAASRSGNGKNRLASTYLTDQEKTGWSGLTRLLSGLDKLAKTEPPENRYQETLKIIIQYLGDNNFRLRVDELGRTFKNNLQRVAPVETGADLSDQRRK